MKKPETNLVPERAVSRESDKFMLRFPDGMRARIAEEAAKNGRSMNAEIVARLERSFNLTVSFQTPEEAAAHAVKVFEEEFRKGVSKALRERLGETWMNVATDPSDISVVSPPPRGGEPDSPQPRKKPRRKLDI